MFFVLLSLYANESELFSRLHVYHHKMLSESSVIFLGTLTPSFFLLVVEVRFIVLKLTNKYSEAVIFQRVLANQLLVAFSLE